MAEVAKLDENSLFLAQFLIYEKMHYCTRHVRLSVRPSVYP
jgi:hypothetical protein